MILEVYLLTQEVNFEEEKQAELLGNEYEPKLNYTKSYINLNYVMRIIPQDKKDVYILGFPDEDVTAKIHPDEFSKIQKG